MKRSIAFATLLLIVTTGWPHRSKMCRSNLKEIGGALSMPESPSSIWLFISPRKDSTLSATLDSPDQGATGLAVDSITLNGKTLRFEMKSLAAEYEGVFSIDWSKIEV
jgi:hypothetical protein